MWILFSNVSLAKANKKPVERNVTKKVKAPPNPDIFPVAGDVFVKHSRYVHSKIKKQRKKLMKSLLVIAGLLLVSGYWGFVAPPPAPSGNSVGAWFYQFIFFVLLGLIPLRLLNMKEYFKLKIVASTNPLMRMSHQGISWWEQPDVNVSWQEIGGFAIRQSKIYALPRIAAFQQDRAHMPLLCIDTALLEVKKHDMLAYLDARLLTEHKNPTAGADILIQ